MVFRGKVKKFLAILVLGLLWCSASFAVGNCNQTPTGNVDDTIYNCDSNDTFDNTGGTYVIKNTGDGVITTSGADEVLIKNSGTIQTTVADTPAINGNNSTNLTITNNSTGLIKSVAKPININNGTDAEITNAGNITSQGAE